MMLIKELFRKIDKIICSYLGLEQEKICPTSVQMQDDKLMVTNTASFKRHLTKESWDNFKILSMQQTSLDNLEKLGVAAGKAIAKNLVISFEEPSIKRI